MFAVPLRESEVLRAVLDQLPRRVSALPQRRIDEGSEHVVIVLGTEVAVRIAREPGSASELLRRQKLVDALPPISLDIPRSLTPVVTVGETSGCAVQFVAGEPAPTGPVPASEL